MREGGTPSPVGPSPGDRILGVVLAGGESRRFGENKALTPFREKPMAAWALEALSPHFLRCVTVANDPAVAEALGIPGRADRVPGLGPLGGLATALEWAREEGLEGVFLLACDLPLVPDDLVAELLARWPRGRPASVPWSPGPLGFEPLCAAYSVNVLPMARDLARAGSRSMERLLEELGVVPTVLKDRSPEALARAFTNVNTRDDARRVEALLDRPGRSPEEDG